MGVRAKGSELVADGDREGCRIKINVHVLAGGQLGHRAEIGLGQAEVDKPFVIDHPGCANLRGQRSQFRALTRATRQRLAEVYAKNKPPAQSEKDIYAIKIKIMQEFRADYARLKAQWGGYGGMDAWVALANNASLGAQAAYDDLVPGFEALFEKHGRDWPRFYDAVRQLSKLAAPERSRQLQQWAQEQKLG